MDESSYLHMLDDLLMVAGALRDLGTAIAARSLSCVLDLPGTQDVVMLSFDEDQAVRATMRGFEFDLLLDADAHDDRA